MSNHSRRDVDRASGRALLLALTGACLLVAAAPAAANMAAPPPSVRLSGIASAAGPT